MIEATAPDLTAVHDASAAPGWQPLPRRARPLFVLAVAPSFALPAAALGGVIGHLTADALLLGALVGFVIGALAGFWLGIKQFGHVRWTLDDSGLAIQRGRLWQRETRVPATRVQHLDLKRGPLQRRRALATLVVHTAGTRNSAVTIPNLDEHDAERLRERLSGQIDDDGA
ncbi:PH domain-containing protein [Lysobacter korlensis]|uniref:PH domain-containing protein n=1 Tax=Lysobacter korlensis TaxID=553636 RepID=A0ABV6RHZ5_9GAMM